MLRRSPRALLLWAAAVAVAIATGAVVATDLATLHRHARELGPERDAVFARRDLPVGATIELSDLGVRRVHRSQLPPNVLATRDDVAGRVVTNPVLDDGFVTTRNIAPRRRTGLDGVLPSGSRAMRAVVADAVRPRRGASVDVLATFEDAGGDEDQANVIAEGVLVLSLDEARTSDGGAGLGVTLLVSPRQSRELAFAITHGVVTIALVPPEDAVRP